MPLGTPHLSAVDMLCLDHETFRLRATHAANNHREGMMTDGNGNREADGYSWGKNMQRVVFVVATLRWQGHCMQC